MSPQPGIHATITALPQELVDGYGRVPFGIFPDTVPRINGRQADYRTPMGKRAGARARHFHYKQFQYFGIISDRLLAGCALADTAWLGLAFFYIFDPESRRLREFTWRSPLARSLQLSDSPTRGESRFCQRGVDIRMGYGQERGTVTVKSLSVALPGTRLEAAMPEAGFTPMSICTRTGINGWTYANKVAGTAVRGFLEQQGQKTALESLDAFGHHDFSAGYMRSPTFWNWACFSGRTGDGRAIGANLSCGVNETGYTENCLWVDGELLKVDTVAFDYDREQLMSSWTITSYDGRVALRFTPEGRHRERMNLALFASNFSQLFGRFEGTLRLKQNETVHIGEQYGFVEEQYAKW